MFLEAAATERCLRAGWRNGRAYRGVAVAVGRPEGKKVGCEVESGGDGEGAGVALVRPPIGDAGGIGAVEGVVLVQGEFARGGDAGGGGGLGGVSGARV